MLDDVTGPRRCPDCGSDNIVLMKIAERIVAAAGGIAGAWVGALTGVSALGQLSLLIGAEELATGAAVGGGLGSILGAIAGAVFGLWGGKSTGRLIDQSISVRYLCLQCQKGFWGA